MNQEIVVQHLITRMLKATLDLSVSQFQNYGMRIKREKEVNTDMDQKSTAVDHSLKFDYRGVKDRLHKDDMYKYMDTEKFKLRVLSQALMLGTLT